MIKNLISVSKVSALALIAMNCISCAHQERESSLMIDKEAPAEEHVWSESRDIQETVATDDSQSEEAQLEEVARQDNPTVENTPDEPKSDSSDEVSELENVLTEKAAVATLETAVATPSEIKSEVSDPAEESKPEPARDIASEPPSEEVVAPSQVEPTIGVPNRLKNSNDRVPAKKPSNNGQNDKQNEKSNLAKNLIADPKQAQVELVQDNEQLERVVPKPSEPVLNALGEEVEPAPQLASVEIATFIQRHWMATLVFALLTLGALYFVLGRKKRDDSQAI